MPVASLEFAEYGDIREQRCFGLDITINTELPGIDNGDAKIGALLTDALTPEEVREHVVKAIECIFPESRPPSSQPFSELKFLYNGGMQVISRPDGTEISEGSIAVVLSINSFFSIKNLLPEENGSISAIVKTLFHRNRHQIAEVMAWSYERHLKEELQSLSPKKFQQGGVVESFFPEDEIPAEIKDLITTLH